MQIEAIKTSYDRAPRPGVEGEYLPATHGHFSTPFFNRLRASLELSAPMVEHTVSLIGYHASENDRVQGSREAPLPMNTQAFHDANEVYSMLVYWSVIWGKALRRNAPGPAVRAWRNESGRVVGLPADMSPPAARYATEIMSRWLLLLLEDILRLDPEEVTFFGEQMQDVFRIAARWPIRMKPRFADVHCPDDNCGGRLAVYPPEKYLDDQRIVCESCGRHIMPDDYGRMVGVMQQQKTDEARAQKVAAQLTRKYAS